MCTLWSTFSDSEGFICYMYGLICVITYICIIYRFTSWKLPQEALWGENIVNTTGTHRWLFTHMSIVVLTYSSASIFSNGFYWYLTIPLHQFKDWYCFFCYTMSHLCNRLFMSVYYVFLLWWKDDQNILQMFFIVFATFGDPTPTWNVCAVDMHVHMYMLPTGCNLANMITLFFCCHLTSFLVHLVINFCD